MRFDFLDRLTVWVNNVNLKVQQKGMQMAFGTSEISENKKRWYSGWFKKKEK